MEIPLPGRIINKQWCEFRSFRGNYFLTLTNLFTNNMKFILPIYFQLCAVCYIPYMNNFFHFLPVLLSLFVDIIMSHAHNYFQVVAHAYLGYFRFWKIQVFKVLLVQTVLLFSPIYSFIHTTMRQTSYGIFSIKKRKEAIPNF